MPNDSSTGGFVQPTSTAPIEAQALGRLLQQMVVGVTGLAGNLVRRRWYPEPPVIPAAAVAWASIGIRNVRADWNAYVAHDPTGNGADVLQRHEEFDLDCSFFDLGEGGQADNLADLLRDGLSIPQNIETLRAAEISVVGVGDLMSVPSLLNERWLYRVDVAVQMRRRIVRSYPILNLLSAPGTVVYDPPIVTTTFDGTKKNTAL
jgi:hypothetical protein